MLRRPLAIVAIVLGATWPAMADDAAKVAQNADPFAGKSLAGWTTAEGKPVDHGWEVVDGVIHMQPGSPRAGNIFTAREYGDFTLAFEWKIAPGGNSGIKYRVRPYGKKLLGCEYQIYDDLGAKKPAQPKNSAGALYDLYEPAPTKKLKPAGEFNSAKIVVRGNHVEHWLNGERVVSATIGDDEWRRRVAESKFSEFGDFARNPQGKIMLTDHGSEVWLRNVRFEPIPATQGDYSLDEGIPYRPEATLSDDDGGAARCRLDLYRPTGVKGFPTVVYYHGGGLIGGKRSIPPALKERGWAVVGASYRLHPQVHCPVYIEDAAAALAWTFKNIESYGGDPSKIFVTGISAGGYLTTMIGLDKSYLAAHEIDPDRIAALIPVTGQMITHYTVRADQGIEKTQPTIDRYAPLYHVRGDAPPILCVTGGWEVDMLMRAEENLYFVSMMKLVGHKRVRQVVIEGADHGRCGKECWPHITEFIEQTLAERGAP
jgi:acetyl esterase/lipase